ncbi:MAG: alcohol dehydrogenase catalytic domain-containing protein [Candidatus Sumerlaeaceae bacterium]
MKQVVVRQFGGPEVLDLIELPTPQPGNGEVRIALTSIGMNHADLMARRGEYKLSSGEPPFTPGIEGGGMIDALGAGVTTHQIGQRVILSPEAPRRFNTTGGMAGTYATHTIVPSQQAFAAPDSIPDNQLGALWLSYLTAWGCLIWKQRLHAGQFVGLPAASSSVAMAAAQVARAVGAIPIGLTTSTEKVENLRSLHGNAYEHIITTHTAEGGSTRWHREIMSLTADHGIDVFFDPVAAGEYLNAEIRCLAAHATIWVYGLLGRPGTVDVSPLIRKHAAIRGWLLNELSADGGAAAGEGCSHILDGFSEGIYQQHLARTFSLGDVRHAHEEMERGAHIGKFVLIP